jgi:RNA polymerase sigma-70 factor (ECF subfamily)
MLYSFDHHARTSDICELQASPTWAQEYPETDEQLMRHIQEGDEAALGILLYRHIALCRNIITRVIGDEIETDALAQKVFAEVARESARYSEEAGPVLGWLATLARRRAIERLREKQNTREAAAERAVQTLTDIHPETRWHARAA